MSNHEKRQKALHLIARVNPLFPTTIVAALEAILDTIPDNQKSEPDGSEDKPDGSQSDS
jgi:hypothetical protein